MNSTKSLVRISIETLHAQLGRHLNTVRHWLFTPILRPRIVGFIQFLLGDDCCDLLHAMSVLMQRLEASKSFARSSLRGEPMLAMSL